MYEQRHVANSSLEKFRVDDVQAWPRPPFSTRSVVGSRRLRESGWQGRSSTRAIGETIFSAAESRKDRLKGKGNGYFAFRWEINVKVLALWRWVLSSRTRVIYTREETTSEAKRLSSKSRVFCFIASLLARWPFIHQTTQYILSSADVLEQSRIKKYITHFSHRDELFLFFSIRRW